MNDRAVAQRRDDPAAEQRVVGLRAEHCPVDLNRPIEHRLGLGGLLQLVMGLAEQPEIAGADAHHQRIALHCRRKAGNEGLGGQMEPRARA